MRVRDSDWGWGQHGRLLGALGAAPRTEHSWEVLEAGRGVALKLPRPETEGRGGGLGEAPGRRAVMEAPHWGRGGKEKDRHEDSRLHQRTSSQQQPRSARGPCWSFSGHLAPLPHPDPSLPTCRLHHLRDADFKSLLGIKRGRRRTPGTDKEEVLSNLLGDTPGSQGPPTAAPAFALFSDPAGSSLVALPSPSPLTADLVSDSKPPWNPTWISGPAGAVTPLWGPALPHSPAGTCLPCPPHPPHV